MTSASPVVRRALRRFLDDDQRARQVAPRLEPRMLEHLAVIASWTRWPREDRTPSGDEALAALILLAALRDWLAETEPGLISTARDAGVTWEELAGVLRAARRRAARRRAARRRAARRRAARLARAAGGSPGRGLSRRPVAEVNPAARRRVPPSDRCPVIRPAQLMTAYERETACPSGTGRPGGPARPDPAAPATTASTAMAAKRAI
jgi:hypothetical protein